MSAEPLSTQIKLDRLSLAFLKQEQPSCVCCGYDAGWVLRLGASTWMFCERDLVNALLDAVNFNVTVPATL